jgi:hypothetical protein
MKAGLIVAVLVLAACSPQEVADKVIARTAEGVISTAVGPQAARCVVDNASPAELREIAVDVGVEAGTSTMVNIMAIARRPATMSCLLASGVGQLRG